MIEYIAAAIVVTAIIVIINWEYFTLIEYTCPNCGKGDYEPRLFCIDCQQETRLEDWKLTRYNPIERILRLKF